MSWSARRGRRLDLDLTSYHSLLGECGSTAAIGRMFFSKMQGGMIDDILGEQIRHFVRDGYAIISQAVPAE